MVKCSPVTWLLTLLHSVTKGHVPQLGLLHLFIPFFDLGGRKGGGSGTFDLTRISFKFGGLLNATMGGSGKTFFK